MPSKIEGGKAVDMAITRLRRLIESDPSAPQVITTVHGTGWIFTTDAVL
jgi:DNA-binding response OmpR family regulator